jgi:hypothetical protein
MPTPFHDDEDSPGLRSYILELQRVSTRLRVVGILTFAFLLLSAGLTVTLLAGDGELFRARLWLIIAQALLSVLTLLSVVFFESTRRHGDALSRVLSDEYQGYFVRTKSRERGEPAETPPNTRVFTNLRFAVSEFASTSELPLAPGRYGPGLYGVLVVALMITSVVGSVRYGFV